jgi:UDP-2,3-diacylglucosamine pyrophosphatase LpxH
LAAGVIERATETVKRALSDAITRSSGYPIEKIIFVMGSDALHTDTAGYTTTKGTQQVTDGSSWAEAFKAAQAAYTHCIASLAPIAPVHCVHVSGNHDELMSWALSQTIQATFSKAKTITFDVDDTPRKYVRFGNSMMCFTHGDKIKPADIPMIVSHEAADMWGQTTYRHVYMGHLHHRIKWKYESIKEYPGLVLEWLRSPKPTDSGTAIMDTWEPRHHLFHPL